MEIKRAFVELMMEFPNIASYQVYLKQLSGIFPPARIGHKEVKMAYQTAEEILNKWVGNSQELKHEAAEIENVKKDILTAKTSIADAIARYKKKKLRTRSKKAADENPFSELDGYESRQQIQDDYGWEIITEDRMYKLMDLWDLREEAKKKGAKGGEYTDRVIDMLTAAMNQIGDAYMDEIFEYDEKLRKMKREAEQVARENNERTWEREHGKQLEGRM